MICDGSSTASRGVVRSRYIPLENSVRSEWPNSWKKVLTSSMLSSEGAPATGRVKLQTRVEIGATRLPFS